ncbi:MAG: hypothetical protein AMXMBFR59_06800 [Rhodanobacteraceae bacterium]
MPQQYENVAQQRVLNALLIVAQHAAEGIAPGAVAKALGTLPSNATRDLSNLRIAGLAIERGGLWFPTLAPWACCEPVGPARTRGRRTAQRPVAPL